MNSTFHVFSFPLMLSNKNFILISRFPWSACNIHWEMKIAYKILILKRESETPFGRPRNATSLNSRQTSCVAKMHLSNDRTHQGAIPFLLSISYIILINIHVVTLGYFLYFEKKSGIMRLTFCLCVYGSPTYLLYAWSSLYETWHIYYGSWACVYGLPHKFLQSVQSVCIPLSFLNNGSVKTLLRQLIHKQQ
jgi:hypothetical protein